MHISIAYIPREHQAILSNPTWVSPYLGVTNLRIDPEALHNGLSLYRPDMFQHSSLEELQQRFLDILVSGYRTFFAQRISERLSIFIEFWRGRAVASVGYIKPNGDFGVLVSKIGDELIDTVSLNRVGDKTTVLKAEELELIDSILTKCHIDAHPHRVATTIYPFIQQYGMVKRTVNQPVARGAHLQRDTKVESMRKPEEYTKKPRRLDLKEGRDFNDFKPFTPSSL